MPGIVKDNVNAIRYPRERKWAMALSRGKKVVTVTGRWPR
jgi:hypothetical protein